MLTSALARADSANHLCSIFDSLLRVEGALFAGEALADDFGVFREAQVLSSGLVAAVEPHAKLSQAEPVWKVNKKSESTM